MQGLSEGAAINEMLDQIISEGESQSDLSTRMLYIEVPNPLPILLRLEGYFSAPPLRVDSAAGTISENGWPSQK